MTKRFLVAALTVVVLGISLFGNPGQSSASFHLMRIKAALGGLNGDANVQYVELRSTSAFQNLLASNSAVLCFFDATGAPYARFKYPADPANNANGASYLVGTTSFDTAWAAGSPDFNFSGNTTAITGGADVDHPVRSPGGKIAFGQDFQSTPALMCQASFTQIDSVVYGSDGPPDPTVDYGTKLASDMPTGSTSGVHLVGALCTFCARDNSLDYAIADLNAGAAQPRNSLNEQGPLISDVDGDGVPDASDNCPRWPNPLQTLPLFGQQPTAGDADCDGFPDPTAVPGKATETYITTNPLLHCAETAGANNDPLPDANPADFNDDRAINGQDTGLFGGPFGAGNHLVSDGPFGPPGNMRPGVRFDFNGDGVINGQDTGKYQFYFNKLCKPAE